MSPGKCSIAIVGGGITGSCAASELAKHFDNVIVFDQGRRGPGGRASHRSVSRNDGAVLPDDDIDSHAASDTFHFDHGCQFFRADTRMMSEELLPDWISKGWAAPWNARLACIYEDDVDDTIDFFGVPSKDDNVYIGVGGMHLLPRKLLAASSAIVHRGTRVKNVQRSEGKWKLYGSSGKAAFHDTSEIEARQQAEELLTEVDAVIFTDISSSSDSWHRASAGIPESLRKRVPQKPKLPLFSCMIALSHPVSDLISLDGFTVKGNSALWFAARSQSKPGFPISDSECWTLISTPSYAVSQIKENMMRDPVTGEFRPQEDDYLNTVPGPALFDAFLNAIKSRLGDRDLPTTVYLQAQRWGSGLPVPASIVGEAEEILGTEYCSELKSSLVFPTEGNTMEFVADDELCLYYAGDFCSDRNPGFETAALSGIQVARHVTNSLWKKNNSVE